jgi:hypothetical protein
VLQKKKKKKKKDVSTYNSKYLNLPCSTYGIQVYSQTLLQEKLRNFNAFKGKGKVCPRTAHEGRGGSRGIALFFV